MMNQQYKVIIIGSGFAGISAARSFHHKLPDEKILLINGEDREPYKRTRISKNIARGYSKEAFALYPSSWYEDQNVRLISGRVKKIDKENRKIHLKSGEIFSWETLIIATGARPRRYFGVKILRKAGDGDLLIREMKGARKAAVIGGGVLGVETADQLSQAGLEVTIYCRGKKLMPLELNDHISLMLQNACKKKGITIRFDSWVKNVTREEESYMVNLEESGELYDLVIECTGSRPNTPLAEEGGLKTGKGILVDENLTTSCPGIFAAGDCTELVDGTVPHLWHQAEDMGSLAGENAAAYLKKEKLQPTFNRPRRLKCEAFNLFIFSINYHLHSSSEEILNLSTPEIYREFGFTGGRLQSVIMEGDRDRARDYEECVWKELTPGEVKKQFEE